MTTHDTTAPRTPILTHRNHFEFGYERDGRFLPFVARKSSTDMWTVKYGRSQRMPMSFRSECCETARTIRRNTDLPIVVLFSGGADSKVALRAFVESGVEVSAAILRFADDLNVHDYAWAVMICETPDKTVGPGKTPPLKKPGGTAAPPGQVGRTATPLNPNNPGKNKK